MQKKPLILVEWEDIAAHTGWIREDSEPEESDTINCVTVGWKIKSNRRTLVIASTRSENRKCTDRTAIPRGCIKSTRRLE